MHSKEKKTKEKAGMGTKDHEKKLSFADHMRWQFSVKRIYTEIYRGREVSTLGAIATRFSHLGWPPLHLFSPLSLSLLLPLPLWLLQSWQR